MYHDVAKITINFLTTSQAQDLAINFSRSLVHKISSSKIRPRRNFHLSYKFTYSLIKSAYIESCRFRTPMRII